MLAADDLSWRRGGPRFRFAARVGDELVGGCEICIRVPGPASVSYWTFPPFRGRGYATRATRLLVDWALNDLGVDTVEVHVEEDNLPSLGVARAAGFEATGRRDDSGLLVLERRA